MTISDLTAFDTTTTLATILTVAEISTEDYCDVIEGNLDVADELEYAYWGEAYGYDIWCYDVDAEDAASAHSWLLLTSDRVRLYAEYSGYIAQHKEGYSREDSLSSLLRFKPTTDEVIWLLFFNGQAILDRFASEKKAADDQAMEELGQFEMEHAKAYASKLK